jgi:hypothetical protein
MLILDSGGVTHLAQRSKQTLALREAGLWPPHVPSVVLVECLQGYAGRDAVHNKFLKTCDITPMVSETLARRAALLRSLADAAQLSTRSSPRRRNQEEP